jgi:hypothetical protein
VINGMVLSHAANVAVINTPLGLLHVTTDRSLQPAQAVTLLIRTEVAVIEPDPFAASSDEWFAETPPGNALRGILIEASFRGRYRRLVIRWNEVDLTFETEAHADLPPLGQPVKVFLPSGAINVI